MIRSNRFGGRPESVVLGELTIAAGMTGHSVALCYEGFPAHVTCELWKHHAAALGGSGLLHIYGQAEIKELRKRLGELRLVLVHAPRLCQATTWAIQIAVDSESATRPAVFCRSAGSEIQQCPGPALVVRGDGNESTAAAHWLETSRSANRLLSAVEPTCELPQFQCLSQSGELTLHGLQQRQVLNALLSGASLLRADGQSGDTSPLTIEDYRLVRTLLQSRIVAGPDETIDLLAANMVRRANVYMSVKYGADVSDANPFATPSIDIAKERTGTAPRRELITRREVADLGNIASRTVRNLIAYLQAQPDGHDSFVKMGLMRHPPNRQEWGSAAAKSLSTFLRGWSVKQVRTHFDRLRQEGLITAERDRGNGPWRYEIPDELRRGSAAFRDLPETIDLSIVAV